ncbi:MAG: MFS transporter [SAR324 cluster bacterium]|nr:MFS transporter [SAR324 cluster bacterium]
MAAFFSKKELSALTSLSIVLFFRMYGVFVILPVFSLYATSLEGATPALIGLGFGSYALTQAIFQVPFGLLSDRWSRKMIIVIGLVIFVAGCVLSAMSTGIYTMILGRLLQGVGAISSVIIALVGDQIKREMQTRAMAFMGMSIGLAFISAFASAPFLAELLGLNGLFWILAFTGICAIAIIILTKMPRPSAVKNLNPVADLIKLLKTGKLNICLIINFSVSFGLSLFMFNLPLLLEKLTIERSDFWYYYLPLVIIGLVVMMVSAIMAERYRKLVAVMGLGSLALILSALLASFSQFSQNHYLTLIAVYIFFIGFNVFEPILPSLAIKISSSTSRGAASGLLNLHQFFGNFCGATVAGLFYVDNKSVPFVLFLILGMIVMYLVARKKNVLDNLI